MSPDGSILVRGRPGLDLHTLGTDAKMCRRKVRHLPVLDPKGAMLGIVTDRDVRHRLFASDVYPQARFRSARSCGRRRSEA